MLIIKMKHSQHQCWDAARGPGTEPPARLESVLQAWVHGLSVYNTPFMMQTFWVVEAHLRMMPGWQPSTS